jgi:hypothetical protein
MENLKGGLQTTFHENQSTVSKVQMGGYLECTVVSQAFYERQRFKTIMKQSSD